MLPSDYFFRDLDLPPRGKRMDCDIYEKDGKYHLEMDLPGYNKEDIKIECHKGNIKITAEHHEEFHNKDKKFICHERHFGKVERSFYLGDICEDTIDAKFNNGTLKLEIETQKEEDKKYITIK